MQWWMTSTLAEARRKWPDLRPFHRLVGWANLELMKNVAELGVVLNLAIDAGAESAAGPRRLRCSVRHAET